MMYTVFIPQTFTSLQVNQAHCCVYTVVFSACYMYISWFAKTESAITALLFLAAGNLPAAVASGGAKSRHHVIDVSIVAGEIAKQTVSIKFLYVCTCRKY